MTAPMKTVVILGASDKPDRASHALLARMLGRGGYAPVPVHPALDSIAGVPVRKNLTEAPSRPDLLTVYVSPDRSTALEADIVRLAPRKVIFNPGAENPALEARLGAAGIETENACSLVLLSQNSL
jgi:predicted CoA-binding protein